MNQVIYSHYLMMTEISLLEGNTVFSHKKSHFGCDNILNTLLASTSFYAWPKQQ